MNRFGQVLIVLCSVLQVSCGTYHETYGTDMPDRSQFKQSELGFATIYNRVLRPSCVGCHGDGGGINLETYANVKLHLGAVKASVFFTKRMPKSPGVPLSASQLGLLSAWIDEGAPEFAPDDDPLPLPMAPNFESIRQNVLVPKCLVCHSPGKPVARIPLVTREDLLNSPLELVIPGNPDESGLMISLTRTDAKMMPPPKDAAGNSTGFTRLSDPEIDAIRLWIVEGADR